MLIGGVTVVGRWEARCKPLLVHTSVHIEHGRKGKEQPCNYSAHAAADRRVSNQRGHRRVFWPPTSTLARRLGTRWEQPHFASELSLANYAASYRCFVTERILERVGLQRPLKLHKSWFLLGLAHKATYLAVLSYYFFKLNFK